MDPAGSGDVPALMVAVVLLGALALGFVVFVRSRHPAPRGPLAGAAAVAVAVAVVALFLGSTSVAVAALFTAAILGAVALS